MLEGSNVVEFRYPSSARWKTLKAATVYFGVAFVTGFILGTVRVLWVVQPNRPRDPISGAAYFLMFDLVELVCLNHRE